MAEEFREGARHGIDPCPRCGEPCLFSSDFKKFGRHSIRVCLPCKSVWHNGRKESDLECPTSPPR